MDLETAEESAQQPSQKRRRDDFGRCMRSCAILQNQLQTAVNMKQTVMFIIHATNCKNL